MSYLYPLPKDPDEAARALGIGMAAKSSHRHCEHCLYWQGQESQYMGDCVNDQVYEARTPFDHTCEHWTVRLK